MTPESIRCDACGAPNTIAAYACAKCGASLISAPPEAWRPPRRSAGPGQPAVVAARKSLPWKKIVLALVAVGVFGVGGWIGMSWAVENRYPFGEPMYDHRPASTWVIELDNEDFAMRRKAALALVTLASKLNRPDAEATIPFLERALSDSDETVRRRAQAALDEISRQHPGITGRREVLPSSSRSDTSPTAPSSARCAHMHRSIAVVRPAGPG